MYVWDIEERSTMKIIYFVGTAGSGKSTLVSTYRSWLLERGIDVAVLNLDPGADTLPYEADVDIREWVSMNEVMDEYALGPNGAQVVAADLMALNVKKLVEAVDGMRSTFLLVDTPGQLELFAFRESSNVIMEALGKERSMTAYLLDPMLCRSPNGFISSLVLSSLVQFRLGVPMINILTKTDTVDRDTVERMVLWHSDEYALYSDLSDESADPSTVVGQELYKAVEGLGMFGDVLAASSETGEGMEGIYAAAGQTFFGGDDPDTDSD